MIPIVAIIGKTNVGKSTLFNQLTKSRNAIVSNINSTTRDRKYGLLAINNKKLNIIDTAGLEFDFQSEIDKFIKKKSMVQTKIALVESDCIIFVVSARDGLLQADYNIAEMIRMFNKNIILVVNKIDGLDKSSIFLDFYDLGFKCIHFISASNGIGISKLINNDLVNLVATNNRKIKNNFNLKSNFKSIKNNFYLLNQEKLLKITVIGRENVGKSTLINALIKEDRLITSDISGTTRDFIDIPFINDNQNYILTDTAGVSKNKSKKDFLKSLSIEKSFTSMSNSNIILLLIDVKDMITHQDLYLLNKMINLGKTVIILVNKWDLLSINQQKKIKNEFYFKLKFLKNFTIYFVSALYNINIKNILLIAKESYFSSVKQFNSSQLTKIMNLAIEKCEPPMSNGKKIKFKYAHPGGYNPLIIIFHGNRLKMLLNSYKRYLQNYFLKSLGLINTPIKLYFKENNNPYVKG